MTKGTYTSWHGKLMGLVHCQWLHAIWLNLYIYLHFFIARKNSWKHILVFYCTDNMISWTSQFPINSTVLENSSWKLVIWFHTSTCRLYRSACQHIMWTKTTLQSWLTNSRPLKCWHANMPTGIHISPSMSYNCIYKSALIYELMNVSYPPFSLIHNLAFHLEIAGIVNKLRSYPVWGQ